MVNAIAHSVNDAIKSITVSGHALFAEYGSDIVCAGISSVVIGGANALDEAGGVADIDGSNHVIILKSTSLQTDIILKTIWIQLQTIAQRYPKHIQLTKG